MTEFVDTAKMNNNVCPYGKTITVFLAKDDIEHYPNGRFVQDTKEIFENIENILDAIADLSNICDMLLITKKRSIRARFSELAEKLREYDYDAVLGMWYYS